MLTSVVLMAGYSRRMGKLKQHVELNGKTFLSRIIDKLLICKNKIQENIFVGQENDELGKMQIAGFGGKWISNLNPENGPLSSIKLALEKVTDSSAIMLWPIDHPMIGANTVELLIDTWKKSPDACWSSGSRDKYNPAGIHRI